MVEGSDGKIFKIFLAKQLQALADIVKNTLDGRGRLQAVKGVRILRKGAQRLQQIVLTKSEYHTLVRVRGEGLQTMANVGLYQKQIVFLQMVIVFTYGEVRIAVVEEQQLVTLVGVNAAKVFCRRSFRDAIKTLHIFKIIQ